MPLTANSSDQVEIQQFGCTISQIQQDVANSALPEKVAVDLVNAACNEMHRARVKEASQMINRAKYILSEFCTEKNHSLCKVLQFVNK